MNIILPTLVNIQKQAWKTKAMMSITKELFSFNCKQTCKPGNKFLLDGDWQSAHVFPVKL